MIHYHGGPITPIDAAARFWATRHAMISFAYPDQLALAAEVCQSFALDNGAFTFWKQGTSGYDLKGYATWCDEWVQHPGFDWALIPDVIDGSEKDNDNLLAEFLGAEWMSREPYRRENYVPVWHMHESLERLGKLARGWPRVAIGSSGEWPDPGSPRWWIRMAEAMEVACDKDGRPLTKLHGLRMLDPTVFSHLPLSSADSTNVARNMGIDKAWTGPYVPTSPMVRATVLASRVEAHASAARWSTSHGVQQNLELLG